VKVRIPVPESGVLRACLDLLAAERIYHERRNTLPVWVNAGNGKYRPVKVAEPGTADIFATPLILASSQVLKHCIVEFGLSFRYHQPLWCETKSSLGRQTPDQKAFQQRVEAAGHVYLLCRDSDTLKAWLIENGAVRRK
jgi:hypothetical protein